MQNNSKQLNTQEHIHSLIYQLSESSKEDYTQILTDFDFEVVDFSAIEHWTPNCYSRNCFYRDENFELILICWDKSQETAIHDHDGEECWVYLLQGELEEDFFRLGSSQQLELTKTKILTENQMTKSDKNSGFHRLRNNTTNRAISLHLYAKPIKQSQTFDNELGSLVEKKLKDDTFKSVTDVETTN